VTVSVHSTYKYNVLLCRRHWIRVCYKARTSRNLLQRSSTKRSPSLLSSDDCTVCCWTVPSACASVVTLLINAHACTSTMFNVTYVNYLSLLIWHILLQVRCASSQEHERLEQRHGTEVTPPMRKSKSAISLILSGLVRPWSKSESERDFSWSERENLRASRIEWNLNSPQFTIKHATIPTQSTDHFVLLPDAIYVNKTAVT